MQEHKTSLSHWSVYLHKWRGRVTEQYRENNGGAIIPQQLEPQPRSIFGIPTGFNLALQIREPTVANSLYTNKNSPKWILIGGNRIVRDLHPFETSTWWDGWQIQGDWSSGLFACPFSNWWAIIHMAVFNWSFHVMVCWQEKGGRPKNDLGRHLCCNLVGGENKRRGEILVSGESIRRGDMQGGMWSLLKVVSYERT